MSVTKETAEQLRRKYPNVVPLKVAAPYLELVAEGRKPYSLLDGHHLYGAADRLCERLPVRGVIKTEGRRSKTGRRSAIIIYV